MDWSDPTVRFGSSVLDSKLEDFSDATLKNIHKRALELLDSLRASRVTLDYLRQVLSVDVVSGQALATDRTASSVMTPLDEKATNKVKGYLRRRVEKLRISLAEDYRDLVPQDRNGFERGFDIFVEECMEHREGFEDSWFEEHVSSGAAQPQLWKIYVAFQRQLRGACEARSKAPLPPPLFMKQEKHRRAFSHKQTQMETSFHRGHTQSCTNFGRIPPHPYTFNGLVSFPCIPYQFTLDSAHRHPETTGCYGAWFMPKGFQDDNGISYSSYDPVMLPVGFQYANPLLYSRKPHNRDH